ncbi:unnamed protein product, partial [Brenthis ino]
MLTHRPKCGVLNESDPSCCALSARAAAERERVWQQSSCGTRSSLSSVRVYCRECAGAGGEPRAVGRGATGRARGSPGREAGSHGRAGARADVVKTNYTRDSRRRTYRSQYSPLGITTEISRQQLSYLTKRNETPRDFTSRVAGHVPGLGGNTYYIVLVTSQHIIQSSRYTQLIQNTTSTERQPRALGRATPRDPASPLLVIFRYT